MLIFEENLALTRKIGENFESVKKNLKARY